MTPLDHALAYAARGWRVAPIPPGHKHVLLELANEDMVKEGRL